MRARNSLASSSDFAAETELASLLVAHDTLRRRNNRDTESTEDARKIFPLLVLTEPGSGDAFNARNNFFAFGTVLKLDSQNALLVVLRESVIFDVAFPLKNVRDSDFNLRAGNFYLLVVDGIGIANAREHIRNRISHCHREPISSFRLVTSWIS